MTVPQRNHSEKKPRGKGKPFVKGDPRINRKGTLVPKDVKELNALIDELLAETSTVKENGRDVAMSKARILLNKLILSKSPVGQIHILDRRFGKVTDKVDVTSGGESLIVTIRKASELNGNKP